MAFAYTWKKELETGHPLIDSQHKALIQALNDLLAACSEGKGRAELERTLKFLNDYTMKHFSDEEKLQQQYRYPDYLSHRQLHESFKKEVRDLSAELLKEGPTLALVSKVNGSLGGWLISHIKKEDGKMAAYIRSHE